MQKSEQSRDFILMTLIYFVQTRSKEHKEKVIAKYLCA